jgi:cobalt transporter subunit CbtB
MSVAIQKLVSLQLSPTLAKILFVLQWVILLAWIPITLYGLFFSPIMALHNAVHPARHSVTIVPCH